MKKIYFLTRTKPELTIPYYLRVCKLSELFEKAFNHDIEVLNFYHKSSRLHQVLHTKVMTKKFIKEKAKDASLIVACGLDPSSTTLIRNYCMKNGIRFYVDVVEFADKKEKKLGNFSPSLRLNHELIKRVITKGCKVLAISHYFQEYFKKKGIETIYVPNLYSKTFDNKDYVEPRDGVLTFAFVGYPHKKDSLDYILRALLKLNEQYPKKFKFLLAGITKDQVFKKWPEFKSEEEKLSGFTEYFGIINDRSKIQEVYLKSHFSILIRDPDLIVCQSGFPTKFVESLSFSRPVISNKTSDIFDYLKDGFNGLQVYGYNSDEILRTLQRAFESFKDINRFCINSFNTAVESFGISTYVENIRKSYEEKH